MLESYDRHVCELTQMIAVDETSKKMLIYSLLSKDMFFLYNLKYPLLTFSIDMITFVLKIIQGRMFRNCKFIFRNIVHCIKLYRSTKKN